MRLFETLSSDLSLCLSVFVYLQRTFDDVDVDVDVDIAVDDDDDYDETNTKAFERSQRKSLKLIL